MNWIDSKFVGLLSGRLRNFKRKGPSLYNFSCPVCGDSETDARKARGFIYEDRRHARAMYHCHNCGDTRSFEKLLRFVDPMLYDEMRLEKMRELAGGRKVEEEYVAPREVSAAPVFGDPLKSLTPVASLDRGHTCLRYVKSRLIPSSELHRLYYTDTFFKWANSVIPGKFKGDRDEPRLVLPFLDPTGKRVVGFQGRSLDPETPSGNRYITCMVGSSDPRVFGLEQIDRSKRVYLLEGPIDALFVRNSVATGGGDVSSALAALEGVETVVVADNEPRNRDTVKKLTRAANRGQHVCVWPQGLAQKDVNDMVKAGMTVDEVKTLIDENTFSGLRALATINAWKRV
jgi:hypothetical protein